MLQTIILLLAISRFAQSSGVVPVAPVGHAPVVTAASSQYFERTFNRLVAAPPVLEPVIPVAPAAPVIPVAPAPPVAVEPVTRTVPAPVNPTQNFPADPNIAIAIATAHAAAPVATILLPPYPFGPPPTFGFIPSLPPKVPDEDRKESTTKSTTKVETTVREPEATTPLPLPSNTDNSFAQALPSNQNGFRQYYAPPLPQLPAAKPQKLRTTVEVVPVPLAYIAPPPLSHSHAYRKPVKYVHTFVPSKAKIIIRPVSAPLMIRPVRIPSRLVTYKVPVLARNVAPRGRNGPKSRTFNTRDTEPTTFRPFNIPVTKPPRA